MKIALYVPSWPPGTNANGIVTYASYLVPALRELGHEVFVLTFAAGGPSCPHTIDLTRFPTKRSLFQRIISRLGPQSLHHLASSAIASAVGELVDKHQIDVFEIEESFGWSFAVSRRRLLPVVVRLHGPAFLMGRFDHPNEKFKIQNEGRAIGDANVVTSCSRDTLDAVRQYYSRTLPSSHIVPNPIEAAPEQAIWRKESCDKNRLLFVGRFDKVKGGDVVLRSFANLATDFPNLRLTFVGPDRGILTDSGERLSFHQFVRQTLPEAVRSRIDFRGQLSHKEVTSLRTRHFITVMAARHDIQGYVMMEAMARGCPIVATAVGGIPEFIKHERNGLLVPSEDPSAMAAACRILLEDNALAERLGRQAWLDCRGLYSPAAIAQQMVQVYRLALNKSDHSLGV
jgi:glycosyltransferase involved in cell wall biosynthesis